MVAQATEGPRDLASRSMTLDQAFAFAIILGTIGLLIASATTWSLCWRFWPRLPDHPLSAMCSREPLAQRAVRLRV